MSAETSNQQQNFLPLLPEKNCLTLTDVHKQPWAATLGALGPADALTGAAAGVGSAAAGAIAAAALVLGLPLAGIIHGYNSSGVLGAVGGLTVGSVVGVLAGAAFVTAGALFCVFQVTSGVLRTPVTIWGHLSGLGCLMWFKIHLIRSHI